MSSTAMSLTDMLEARVAVNPDAVCLIDERQPISWRTLQRDSAAVAAGLAARGIVAGDRVAVWLPNRSAWLVTFFACARLGAIAVSINTRFRSAEVADLLYRSGARLLFYWPGFKDIDFSGILAQCPADSLVALQGVVLYTEEAQPLPATVVGKPALDYRDLVAQTPLATAAGTADSPCVIFTTSGTTKAPKLVVHLQRNVVAHARNVSTQYGLARGDCMLLLPPFCGVYGFCTALTALFAGLPLVLAPTWHPGRFADLLDEFRATHLAASNEAATQLLEARADRQPAYPSVKFFVSANINPAYNDIPQRGAAQGIEVLGLYGSSEMQALFSLCDRDGDVERRGRPGGRPASSLARVRARDPESGQVCAHGQAGELEMFAPESRFHEYFNDPEATRNAITADGYFKTGDLGYTEADGNFTYLGRMGDTLRLGGFLVSPAEIEALIQEMPAVEACQLVGAVTASGVKPVAFIRLAAGAMTDEVAVIAYTAERLAKYKVPVRVVTVDEFPTTPSANGSKVQKNKLRDMAEALLNGG